MSAEKFEPSASINKRAGAQSDTDGFVSLQVEAVHGPLHYPNPKSIPSQFTTTAKDAATSKLSDSSSAQLGMMSSDGGWITFDKARNIVGWESKDGKTMRHFTYHDSSNERKALLGIANEKVYQDANGTFFQFADIDGEKVPQPKLLTRAYDADTYADLRGAAHKEAIFHRAVDANGAPTIAPISLHQNLELSGALDMVADNNGHVWRRLQPGQPLAEFVKDKSGKEVRTGKSLTDAELLPHDFFNDPEKQKLYNDANNPLDSVRSVSVQQTSLPDCYFESALIDIVHANPKRIPELITDNHDGTFTVKFPLSDPTFKSEVDFLKRPTVDVTVDAPTPEELLSFNAPFQRGQKFGYWSSVLEKAHRYLSGKISEEEGGVSGDAMQLLSGVRAVTSFEKNQSGSFEKQSYGFDPRDTKPSEAAPNWLQDIKSALQYGKSVSVNTPHNGDEWLKITGGTNDLSVLGKTSNSKNEPHKFHLLDDHIFSVVRVEHDEHHNVDMITLRNPVGSVLAAKSSSEILPFDRDNDGYLQMQPKDFERLFRGFYVNDSTK